MSVLISDSFKIRESTSDEWEDIQFSINSPGVPVGGTAGQILAKNSTTNYDTEWIDLPGIPTGGTAGQYLIKQSGTDYNTAWATRAHIVNPNLLDNWYFVGGGSQLGYGVFPLNSKGQTSYTGTGTTINNWEGSGSHSILTLYSDGIVVTSNSSGSDGYISQFFANQSLLAGKIVTLSVLGSNGELKSQTATLPNTFSASTTFIRFDLTDGPTVYLRCSSSGQLSVRFMTRAQSLSTKIVAVKFELGSTQTLAHQENGVWVLNEVPKYRLEAARPWKLLWENASPTSSFAAQTISIDLSIYDFVIIGINGWSDDTKITYQVCEKGKTAAHIQMRNAQYNNSNCAVFQRNLTVSDNGIVVGECIGKGNVASVSIATQNSGLVPAKIYGV